MPLPAGRPRRYGVPVHDDVHASAPRPAPLLPPPADHGALPRQGRPWFVAFGVVLAVHLLAHLTIQDGPPVTRWTQWLLMPVLALALWFSTTAPRARLVRLALVALAWSWAGDTFPDLVPDDVSFLVLMALFLVGQVAYIAAFLPYRGQSVLARRRWVVGLYALVYLGIVGGAGVALLPGGADAAPLVIGLVVYGAALVTMAVLATGVHVLAGIGGALFVASDSLLGLRQALPAIDDSLPAGVYGFAVMATYGTAQLLLVLGLRRRADAPMPRQACPGTL